jgi:hypothetical protein
MNNLKIIAIIFSLSIISCNDSTQKTKSVDSKPASKEEELELGNSDFLEDKSTIDSELEVERNLAQGENDKFLIRVDRLSNEKLMYRSWSKSKTLDDKPDLELEDGIIEKQGTGGGYHYIFNNGEWKYIVEDNQMGESEESIGLFIRLLQNDVEKLYSKLNDITIDDSEKESYSKSDLIGRWWTPHYAVRKIDFFEDNRFKFNDGNDSISNGIYSYSTRKVTLSFDSNTENIVMELGGGNNDYSYTLVGDGENFVNER